MNDKFDELAKGLAPSVTRRLWKNSEAGACCWSSPTRTAVSAYCCTLVKNLFIRSHATSICSSDVAKQQRR